MNLGKRLEFVGDIQESILLLAKSWYRDKRVLHFARGPAGKRCVKSYLRRSSNAMSCGADHESHTAYVDETA